MVMFVLISQAIRLQRFEFIFVNYFQNFSYSATYEYTKGNTHRAIEVSRGYRKHLHRDLSKNLKVNSIQYKIEYFKTF